MVQAESSAPVAECPLGFGRGARSGGVRRGEQGTCGLCGALSCAPVRAVPCGCPYCGGCARQLRDCVLCGRDIEGTEHDARADAMTRALLDAHARSSASVTARMLLQFALQHESKNNVDAAVERYKEAARFYGMASSNRDSGSGEEASAEHSIARAAAMSKAALLSCMSHAYGQESHNAFRTAELELLRLLCVTSDLDSIRADESREEHGIAAPPAVLVQRIEPHDKSRRSALEALGVLYSQWGHTLWEKDPRACARLYAKSVRCRNVVFAARREAAAAAAVGASRAVESHDAVTSDGLARAGPAEGDDSEEPGECGALSLARARLALAVAQQHAHEPVAAIRRTLCETLRALRVHTRLATCPRSDSDRQLADAIATRALHDLQNL